MKATYYILLGAAWAVAWTFLSMTCSCTTTTTYHADGSKSVIKTPDAGAVAAITATAIAFAPKARVVEQKGGSGTDIHEALENAPKAPLEARITPLEIENRNK
jgi:hypothetical protein